MDNATGTAPVAPPRTIQKPQTTPSNLTANTFSGAFKAPEYIENALDGEDDLKVSEHVRNFWEPANCEHGGIRPPLLTTPGIQTSNDLVRKDTIYIYFFVCIYSS